MKTIITVELEVEIDYFHENTMLKHLAEIEAEGFLEDITYRVWTGSEKELTGKVKSVTAGFPKPSGWVKFENQLPTVADLDQVDILFTSPGWATIFMGMYNHQTDKSVIERVFQYDTATDSMIDWDSIMPTHYMISPKMPEA